MATLLVCLGICAASYLMVGCVGELKEITDNDMSGSVGDMAMSTMGDGGSGGGVHFFPDIQNDLTAKSCAVNGCHGGATGNDPKLVPMPAASADQNSNYNNMKMAALNGASPDPTKSNLLVTLLPGSGHGGGAVLVSTTNEYYLRWLTWIKAGAPR